MQCIGRLKNKKWVRCKNPARKRSLVCKKHSYQLFILLFITLPAIIAAYTNINRNIVQPIMNPTVEKSPEQIESLVEKYGSLIDDSDLPKERFIAKKYEAIFDKDYYRYLDELCTDCDLKSCALYPLRNIENNGQGFFIVESTKEIKLAYYLTNLLTLKGIDSWIGIDDETLLGDQNDYTYHVFTFDIDEFFNLCKSCKKAIYYDIKFNANAGIRRIAKTNYYKDEQKRTNLLFPEMIVEVTLGKFTPHQVCVDDIKTFKYYHLQELNRIGSGSFKEIESTKRKELKWIRDAMNKITPEQIKATHPFEFN